MRKPLAFILDLKSKGEAGLLESCNPYGVCKGCPNFVISDIRDEIWDWVSKLVGCGSFWEWGYDRLGAKSEIVVMLWKGCGILLKGKFRGFVFKDTSWAGGYTVSLEG